MKTININIDEIKRFPTVTNPIKADDLHTPQAYAYTLRRAIVTDCTTEQRAELVELLNGKDTAEGVTFNNTKANRNRLHRWQNEQSRKERAAILGEGWQYIEGLNHGTQPGDLVTCVDGTRGRVTKSNQRFCVIEFETENGQRLTVAGYFRYTPSEKSENTTTEAEGIKVGDKVRHNKHEEVATVTAIREAFVNGCDGYRYLYTLDFGQSVTGPFGVELNGGEFLREAFAPCTDGDYYSEYQKLSHQEARPQAWLEKATDEEREAYYRACVKLERMAGDGLPLVIRADSADLTVNPWNALEKRVKTARVFHLGDRVRMKNGNQEVTGTVNGIRCNRGSLSLGGWCTHYNIRYDEQCQYTTGYGTVTGCGNISPERIELVERAEFCPEPASEWLQPGEKVAHYLDYGDGTGDWLTGCVTGYDMDDDNEGVTVIYGEYRTQLKDIVKYQPEMAENAA